MKMVVHRVMFLLLAAMVCVGYGKDGAEHIDDIVDADGKSVAE